MKRIAAVLVALAALAPSALAGPMASPAVRERTIARVKQGLRACPSCDLFQADFSYMSLASRNFTGARLRQADLQLAEADGAQFRGADLSIVNAFGARFSRADFSGADLSRGNFVGAFFGGANFAGAKLDGAILSGADLSTARGLTQALISKACGDAATRLPPGLSTSAC